MRACVCVFARWERSAEVGGRDTISSRIRNIHSNCVFAVSVFAFCLLWQSKAIAHQLETTKQIENVLRSTKNKRMQAKVWSLGCCVCLCVCSNGIGIRRAFYPQKPSIIIIIMNMYWDQSIDTHSAYTHSAKQKQPYHLIRRALVLFFIVVFFAGFIRSSSYVRQVGCCGNRIV